MLRHPWIPLAFLLVCVPLAILSPDAAASPADLISTGTFVDEGSLAFASNGDIFVCFTRDDAAFMDQIVILRSNNGGLNWNEWAVLGDGAAGESLEKPRMRIAAGPSSERIFIAYDNHQNFYEVVVAFADVNSLSPSFTQIEVMDYDVGTIGSFPRVNSLDIDVRTDPLNPTVVAVAAAIELADSEIEWRYAVSTDAGATFSPEAVIFADTFPEYPWAGVAVSLGPGDRAHLAVTHMTAGATGDDARLQFYSTAANGLAGWPILPTAIASFDYGLRDLCMLSEPGGSDLVIAAMDSEIGATAELEIWASTDHGFTWSDPLVDTADVPVDPSLSWTSTGFVLACRVERQGYVYLRPDGPITSRWEASTTLVREPHYEHDLPSLAEDPTRPGQYAMVVTVDMESSSDAGVWFEADWRDGVGYGVSGTIEPLHPDDPFGQQVFNSAPAIGDLDDDGVREIVITSRSPLPGGLGGSQLTVYSAGQPSVSADLFSAAAASAPVLFDIDGDGDLEVFVGSELGGVEAFDDDLVALENWPRNFMGQTGSTWVSAGIVGGFSYGEIVAVSGDQVHLLDRQGVERPGWPWTSPSGSGVGRAAIGDVDGDGTTEVVAAFTDGVFVLNHDGTLNREFLSPHVPSTGVTLADLDADGDLEILGPMADGLVLVVHHDGGAYAPTFPFDSGTGQPVSAIAVANVLTGTAPTLCFASGTTLFALDADGVDLPGFPQASGGAELLEPIVARVAEPTTPRPQILVGDDSGWVHEWASDATTPLDWPHAYGDEPTLPPAVGDVDDDGIAEIVVATGENLWILDSGVPAIGGGPARRWAMSGHDRARSGCADCLPTTPTAVEPIQPEGTRISFVGASPNPSPGRATFHFSMPFQARVDLTLYDLRGRRVKSLLSDTKAAGTHQVFWNGRDQAGSLVAAGSYFGRLVVTSDGVSEVLVRDMVVVR